MKPIKAHFDGKQVVFDEEVNLKPNTRLTVIVHEGVSVEMKSENDEQYDLLSIFGIPIPTGIKDFAEQHDHYLYGTPKRPN